MIDRPAFVLLEDGAWFAGSTRQNLDPAFGEVVFTTNLTGYQETFTDPSYLGQIVVMTAPMIGNYGINVDDMESARPQVSGVVVRELSRHASNWRSTRAWMTGWPPRVSLYSKASTPADSRATSGSAGRCAGWYREGREPTDELTSRLLASPSMEGLDLASRAIGQGPVD